MRYEWRQIDHDGVGSPFDVDGRIVHVIETGETYRSKLTALVELPADAEGVTVNRPLREVEAEVTVGDMSAADPTCAGKDGDCSRTVDAEGDRCWQHPAEDE